MMQKNYYDIPDDFNKDLKIFSGSSHPRLARDICMQLRIPLSETEIDRFPNDNLWVQIQENSREKDVFVVQTASPPVNEHMMELFLMIDALKHASAHRVTVVMPYYAYVRSDKKDAPRISVAARLMADLMEASGADRLLTMNLHSGQVQGFFQVPADHLTAVPILCEYFREKLNLDDPEIAKQFIVVAPDAGSAKRAGQYAQRLDLPLAVGDKRRIDSETVTMHGVVGDVEGKNIIIFDDEIATGGSIVQLVEMLKRDYNVGKIYAGAAHGVLVGPAIERFTNAPIEEIVVTDSLPLPDEKKMDRITQVSVAPLLASAIYAIHTGESVSALFR
ncbi:MAG: ribose-phosphate pyrophosphokinase [Armatimonadota bacterium]